MESDITSDPKPQAVATEGKPPDIVQLAGMVGSASVFLIFISALTSWAYVRGVLSSLGLPAALVTFRSAIDFLPSVAFLDALVFVTMLTAGFFIPAPRTEKMVSIHRGILIFAGIGFIIAIVAYGKQDQPPYWFSKFSQIIAVLAPVTVGYVFKTSGASQKGKAAILAVAVFLVLAAWTRSLYTLGFGIGRGILTDQWSNIPRSGMTEVKPTDFPRVIIRVKEQLAYMPNDVHNGSDFIYPSKDTDFLRFILRDDAEYYFVHNSNGVITTFAIRKDLISEIVFLENAPTKAEIAPTSEQKPPSANH